MYPTLSDQQIRSIRRILFRWGRQNFKQLPWRRPARLWHGLVAEVLLQRTKAGTAARTYSKFVLRYHDPSQLADAEISEIEELVRPLGLPQRAHQLQKLGMALSKRKGVPPEKFEDLLKLPGIGPYAAAAYLSFHRGHRATIIDANVVRWICRLVDYDYDGETRRKKWFIALATRLTPRKEVRAYNFAVLDFTIDVCSPRPKCSRCPIGAAYCQYGRKVLDQTIN
jgi:A/G-specific adenine glycosylase